MYEVMARRYRPALFDQVVGQEHIAATLRNAITRDRVAHAYMFTGGHGCGKTTMARILAKALVCQNGPTPDPCCVCPICVDVAAGRDSDVLEIDGASNNGIEQIRQLREQAAYVPTRARFKIYIIDEVHMLSDGAFNALLKTLEEPPRHVKFILATTDPHKVPDTILSRCQRFDFRLVPQAKLSAFFRHLAGEEKAEISDEALDAVAAFAEGSVRDGLVLLDQLLSFADGRVERQDVEAVRGVASAENVAGLFRAIAAADVRQALAVVDEVASRGTNVGDFLDQLISFGRDLMMLTASGREDVVSAFGPARDSLLELAGRTGLESALLYLDVLTQARTRVRSRALSNPLVALEMAVARLSGLGGVTPVSELLTRLSQFPIEGAAPLPPAPAPAVAIPQTQPQPAAAATAQVPVAATLPIAERQPVVPPVAERPAAQPEQEKIPDSPAPIPPRKEEWIEPARPTDAMPQASEMEMPIEPDFQDDGEDWPFEPDNAPAVPARNARPASVSPVVAVSPAPLTSERINGLWSKILDQLAEQHPADFRHMLRMNLEGVRDGKIVLSGTPTAIEAWYDRHRLERLTGTASEVLGGAAEFEFEAKASRRLAARKTADNDQTVAELSRHPTVDKVRSLFEGVIVHCEAAETPAPDETCSYVGDAPDDED